MGRTEQSAGPAPSAVRECGVGSRCGGMGSGLALTGRTAPASMPAQLSPGLRMAQVPVTTAQITPLAGVRPLPLPGHEDDVGAPATWPEAIVISRRVPLGSLVREPLGYPGPVDALLFEADPSAEAVRDQVVVQRPLLDGEPVEASSGRRRLDHPSIAVGQ